MATILLTGAAGFIGSHTADMLLAGGHRVIGVDNFRTGHLHNIGSAMKQKSFSLREIDVSIDGELERIAAECAPDAIIHLAALVSVQESIKNPGLNYRLNVCASHFVVEAARRCKVPRVVFASSAAVYGDEDHLPLNEVGAVHPISPYGAAKLASEYLLLGHAATYGLTVRCQRYFNVYGPRQDPASPYSGVISIFARSFRENHPIVVFGNGEQTRDFIAVSDVARANVLAATLPNLSSGVANICTGRRTSLEKIFEILAKIHASAPLRQYSLAREGDILHSLGDPSAALRDLGFVASTDIAEGLATLIYSLH